jgi:hypothetical protein
MAVPQWTNNLTNLREILTGLYYERDMAKTVADEAGIKWSRAAPSTGNMQVVWHALIKEALLQGLVDKIVEIAAKEYPQQADELRKTLTVDQPSVQSPFKISETEWKSEIPPDQQEKIIGKQSTLLPIGFLEQGLKRASSVVRIVTADHMSGSGFLIDKNLIVTNHHVLKDEAAASGATVQFNFEKSIDGLDKPISSSKCRPDLGFKTSKDHDWTVVKLDGDMNATWGAIPLKPAQVAREDRVVIIQHPGGGPKQIALSHNLVTFVDNDIIQYLSDTMPGSSGSPVFNENWEVVALHHSGGWLREPGGKEQLFRNEGIAIGQILTGAKELLEG